MISINSFVNFWHQNLSLWFPSPEGTTGNFATETLAQWNTGFAVGVTVRVAVGVIDGVVVIYWESITYYLENIEMNSGKDTLTCYFCINSI